jgi:hypothetical protein
LSKRGFTSSHPLLPFFPTPSTHANGGESERERRREIENDGKEEIKVCIELQKGEYVKRVIRME